MLKLRIAILSVVLLVACVAGAFWAVLAAEKLAPADSPLAGYGRRVVPPPAAVASGPVRPSAPPAASDVRSVRTLLDRLRAAMDERDADWRSLCALADDAVRFGAAAVEPLSRVAGDEGQPTGFRLLALDMLARIDDPSAVPAILGCLSTRVREDVRVAAVRSLAANPAARLRASWIFFDLFASDPHPSVRACAADFVGRSGDDRAAPMLRKALLSDPSPVVRLASASSLGALADPSALDALRDAATGDPDPTVRTASIEAAGNYLDPQLRAFFQGIERGSDTESVRCAARRQLWRLPADH